MVVSRKTKERWKAQWADPEFEKRILEDLKAREADPFSYSQLPYWLGLEVWSREEGLLILANVEPGTVQCGPDHLLVIVPSFEWTNAMPFDEHLAFFQVPPPPDWTIEHFEGDLERFDNYLEVLEKRRGILQGVQSTFESLLHRLDHSPSALSSDGALFSSGYRPISMIAWARSIGFKPKWYDWAEKRGLIPEAVTLTAAPFFDADSSDYPFLLHVAVRAWESAKAGADGTPRQRIEAFLRSNYPDLTDATRDAIASVANWQKRPGRPKAK